MADLPVLNSMIHDVCYCTINKNIFLRKVLPVPHANPSTLERDITSVITILWHHGIRALRTNPSTMWYTMTAQQAPWSLATQADLVWWSKSRFLMKEELSSQITKVWPRKVGSVQRCHASWTLLYWKELSSWICITQTVLVRIFYNSCPV